MAKKGLNYYSVDTDRYLDIRVKRLKKAHGCEGIAVYDYILCSIYREEGCFLEWDSNRAFDCADYFGIEEEEVNNIIKCCAKIGLFSENILNTYKILTSKSIQNRYIEFSLKARRKELNIPEEIKINTEELPQNLENYGKISENEVKNEENTEELPQNPENYGNTPTFSHEERKEESTIKKERERESISHKDLLEIDQCFITLNFDTTWLNEFSKNNQVTPEHIKVKLIEFFKVLKNRSVKQKSIEDAKAHFASWLAKQPSEKIYTYREMEKLIFSHGYTQSDFYMIDIDGKKHWKLKNK